MPHLRRCPQHLRYERLRDDLLTKDGRDQNDWDFAADLARAERALKTRPGRGKRSRPEQDAEA